MRYIPSYIDSTDSQTSTSLPYRRSSSRSWSTVLSPWQRPLKGFCDQSTSSRVYAAVVPSFQSTIFPWEQDIALTTSIESCLITWVHSLNSGPSVSHQAPWWTLLTKFTLKLWTVSWGSWMIDRWCARIPCIQSSEEAVMRSVITASTTACHTNGLPRVHYLS